MIRVIRKIDVPRTALRTTHIGKLKKIEKRKFNLNFRKINPDVAGVVDLRTPKAIVTKTDKKSVKLM